MRRIAAVVSVTVLMASAAAWAAPPDTYLGFTNQKFAPSCRTSCAQDPIELTIGGQKLTSVLLDADFTGARKCPTLDGSQGTSLDYAFGQPRLRIKHGTFNGTMKADRYTILKIRGTVTSTEITGSLSMKVTFLQFHGSRLTGLGPTCHTGKVTFTAPKR